MDQSANHAPQTLDPSGCCSHRIGLEKYSEDLALIWALAVVRVKPMMTLEISPYDAAGMAHTPSWLQESTSQCM